MWTPGLDRVRRWAWFRIRGLPRRPAMHYLVLARTGHPSFSPRAAEVMVRDLALRQLEAIWDESSRLLTQPLHAEMLVNVVVLREHVLRRLEELEPGALELLRGGRPEQAGHQRPRRRPTRRTRA